MNHNIINSRKDKYEQIYDILREKAEKQECIYYGELANKIGFDINDKKDRKDLFDILGKISEKENAEDRPLLSVIVISKEKNIPGNGFMSYMTEIGAYSGSYDKKEFIRSEIEKVHNYWK